MAGVFGSKPSDAHVIWRSGRDDDGKKRFDFEYLQLWAAHFGVDYETWERTDHERGDEPRTQHACVFSWAETGGQELSMGEDSWNMGASKKPRTFIEIDERGLVRFRSWTSEVVFDVETMVLDRTVCTLQTADGERKSLDVRKLATEPPTA